MTQHTPINVIQNADPSILATKLFGTQKQHSWPGPQITQLDQYNNFCFNLAAEVNKNADILQTPQGQKCKQAVLNQYKLNGRLYPENHFKLPITPSKSHTFLEKYLDSGNIDDSYKAAIKECNSLSCNERQQCIDNANNVKKLLHLSANELGNLENNNDCNEFPEKKYSSEGMGNICEKYHCDDMLDYDEHIYENKRCRKLRPVISSGIVMTIFIFIIILILICGLTNKN